MSEQTGAFVLLLCGGLVLGFGGGLTWRGQEIVNAQSAEHVAELERDRYKDAANGQDPNQLQATLADMQKRLGALEDKKPADAQLQEVRSWLSSKPSDVTITYDPLNGTYAKAMEGAFSGSGWNVAVDSPVLSPANGPPVILTTATPESAATIRKALDAANLKYTVHPDVGANKTQQLWLDAVQPHTGAHG